MLKNRADIKTLVWAMAITAVALWNWRLSEFHWVPFLLECLCGVFVTSMVHNHVHVNIFKFKALNVPYDYWLTVFYGYPVFAWISTHNRNHHVYNNQEGDFAPPFMMSEKNNLLTFLTYPTVSGSVQQKVNFVYLKKLWRSDRVKCLYYASQFMVLLGFVVGAFFLSWKKALLYVVIPQQVSLNMVLLFNYVQHIHCDEKSKFNHSRNIVGPVLNFLMFNNGYHTAHHRWPLAHWSELKSRHSRISHEIDPRLNERSFVWMVIRMYLLVPFLPFLRGPDLRGERLGSGIGFSK